STVECGACDLSCTDLAVPGRAWLVFLATSCGATTPATSPATMASRAARSERQIVVLLIQRLRERVERLRLALGRDFGRGLGARELAGAFAASPGGQQDHFPRGDLGDVTSLLLAIFPRAVLDPPFHVDAAALFHVLLVQTGQLGALVVPEDDAMRLSLLRFLPALPRQP